MLGQLLARLQGEKCDCVCSTVTTHTHTHNVVTVYSLSTVDGS